VPLASRIARRGLTAAGLAATCLAALSLAGGGAGARASRPALWGYVHVSGLFGQKVPPPYLSRFDPRTLEPIGRRLLLPEGFPMGFSPDAKLFLLGGDRPEAVDLPGLRFDTALQSRLEGLFANGSLAQLWQGSSRIVNVSHHRCASGVSCGLTFEAMNIHTGSIVWSFNLPFTNYLGATTVGGTVVYAQEGNALQGNVVGAHATIWTVSPSGAHRAGSLTLERSAEGEYASSLVTTPGPSGPHLYLVTTGRVYSIDLVTGRATLHVIKPPSGSPAWAASPESFSPEAQALGNRIVVSGFFRLPGGKSRGGLYIIDPATWTARTVVATTPYWITTAHTLVTWTDAHQVIWTNAYRYGQHWSWAAGGTGVRIYDGQGRLVGHLFGRRVFELGVQTPDMIAFIVPSTAFVDSHSCFTCDFARLQHKRYRELAFDPATGKSLGYRLEPALPPELLQSG
jgi:hypothetical protein